MNPVPVNAPLDREARLRELGLWPMWRLARPVEDDAALAAEALPPAAPHEALPHEVLPHEVLPSAPRDTPPAARIAPAVASAALDALDWDALNEAVSACTACALHQSRSRAVFGVGDRRAQWLVIGEAPGAEEDRQGQPFVGQAGKLLDAMLAALGLKRGEGVYIANVLKSRPPANRDPSPDEVAACLPYLQRQIALIQPRIILALGRFAAQSLLLTDTPIGKLRGRVHVYQGVPMVVTYHPAYLLRNPADKAKVWDDLLLARRTWRAGDAS